VTSARRTNNRWLVYGANFDVNSNSEIQATWIYRHDVNTGERVALAKPHKATAIWPQLSPTGDHVLYTRRDLHPSGQQIWLVDIEGRDDHELFNFGEQVKTTAAWFPDGRSIVIVAEHKTYRRLGVCNLATTQMQWLIDDPSINIESASVPFGSDQIVVSEAKEARAASFLLDPPTRAVNRLADGRFDNIVLIGPAENKRWIGQIFSSTRPEELISFSINSPRDFVVLSCAWEQTSLTPQDLHSAQDFHWQSVDGRQIQGWFYRTKAQARGTIVYVHGGPTFHSENRVNPEIQFLLTQGFNILDPNYRGSTGFSLEFKEAIKAEGWGAQEQQDIRCGIEALIGRGLAERGKIGITGTSYGGYSAWSAITRFPPDIVAAAAPICGMTDLVVDYQTTRPDLRPYSEEMLGGSPLTVPKRYYERSPINHIANIRGRVLIVQGMQDPNVTPENLRVVIAALEQAGVAYELLTFEDEGHGIYKRHNQKVLYQRLAEFFGRVFSQ
jgi:dipeptidyl aminopeptidase/acylaminoacyl peptidase